MQLKDAELIYIKPKFTVCFRGDEQINAIKNI